MIKNILVPTDFSKCALNAAKNAAVIAKKNNATLHFLHVVEVPVVTYDVGMVNFESFPQAMFMKEIADSNLEKLLEEDFLKGVNIKTTIQYDAIYKRINQYVDKANIDLIILGTHGTSGIGEHIIGSNAERVTRYTSCPVLTLKEQTNISEVKDIVLASNFYGEVDYMMQEFKKIESLFDDTTVHLLKVITPSNFESTPRSKKILADFIKEHRLTNATSNVYNYSDEEEGIIKFSDDINADLIVLGTHGRTGIAHLLKGSLTEDVLNHAPKPVLSIKIDYPEQKHDMLFPE